jgi:hypothetical protein
MIKKQYKKYPEWALKSDFLFFILGEISYNNAAFMRRIKQFIKSHLILF